MSGSHSSRQEPFAQPELLLYDTVPVTAEVKDPLLATPPFNVSVFEETANVPCKIWNESATVAFVLEPSEAKVPLFIVSLLNVSSPEDFVIVCAVVPLNVAVAVVGANEPASLQRPATLMLLLLAFRLFPELMVTLFLTTRNVSSRAVTVGVVPATRKLKTGAIVLTAIVSPLAVEASPISMVPPVTEYVVEPVLRNPSLDPATPFECLIMIDPPVISKYDPGTLIEKGASAVLVDPIVGTFKVPPDIVKIVVAKAL